jgi:hypothetical protein
VAAGNWRLVSTLPAHGEVWWCEMAEIGLHASPRFPCLTLFSSAVQLNSEGPVFWPKIQVPRAATCDGPSEITPIISAPLRKGVYIYTDTIVGAKHFDSIPLIKL